MARYIDADKLIEVLKEHRDYYAPNLSKITNEAMSCGLSLAIKEAKNTPTADVVEAKHAKWEINCDGYYPYCSHCKTEPKNGVMSKHCPECGAKMDNTPKERGGE